jgi:hypothetical protein
MSLSTRITRDFGDGPHEFQLPVKQLDALQDECGCGPAELFLRLMSHRWKRKDIRETIRLGLIGAGMDSMAALRLVKLYVDDQPLMQFVPIAKDIVEAVLQGIAEVTEGKTTAAKEKPKRRETAPTVSTSPPSTAQQPQ